MKRILGIIALTLFFSFIPLYVDKDIFSALFTVTGILFPIGISIIIGFDLRDILHEPTVARFKRTLNGIQKSFVIHFALSTILFLLSGAIVGKIFTWKFLVLSLPAFFCALFLYIIIYLVYNFIELQNLKHDIDDRIRKTKREAE